VISVSDVSMHQWEEPEGSGPGSSKAERTGEATGPTDMTLEVTLKLAGVGVSVIDSTPQVSPDSKISFQFPVSTNIRGFDSAIREFDSTF
jgi:hypothetical protein